ncbi:hypothetical protein STPYR_10283 [uncultured Stenotrophomonas sp.]|uniref:Uncharacterized protein n=1 Tax=uncultured Stenotrophomonas sp. TaxID=165438 RepID=A0A1Y5PZA7_9GAMM|nr:hypothetical protein STPYR_10283 [uncultured Stenotrophomonas sp.]
MGGWVLFRGLDIIAMVVPFYMNGIRMMLAMRKYEFESRTGGGVVRFKDFEVTHVHRRRETMARSIQWVAVCIAVAGCGVIVTGMVILGN